jgi:cytochrome c biogenesis protein CcdA
LAAGLAAALSPCVLPLFITHITSSIKMKEASASTSITCALLAALGVAALGLLFLVFSDAVLGVQKIIPPVVGAAVLAAGLASLLNVPMDVTTAKLNKRSTHVFCTLYGFLSVQCNLPLVIGALLLIATAGGMSTLVGFALGIGIPLAIISYLAPKAKNLVITITKKSKEIELASAALMVIAGVYLLLYSFGIIV